MRTPLRKREVQSLSKMKALKLNSIQLFKEAHKASGETLLKELPSSIFLQTKGFSIMRKDSQNLDKVSHIQRANSNSSQR